MVIGNNLNILHNLDMYGEGSNFKKWDENDSITIAFEASTPLYSW